MIITDPTDYRTAKAVSFSWLKAFEADEDVFYRRFVLGEIPDEEPEESRALAVGTAAHCLVLEGADEFARRFAIAPATYEGKKGTRPWNNNAKLCQLWTEAQEELGKAVISSKEAALLHKMRRSLEGNPEALALLEGSSCELAIRRHYTELGFDRQGRLDAINHDAGAILDVKTIENINDRTWVREQRRYHRQLAYYQDLAEEEYAGAYRCGIVWLEKSWPYRCALEWLNPDLVEYGRGTNTNLLNTLAKRFATNSWKVVPAVAEIGPSAEMIWDAEYA